MSEKNEKGDYHSLQQSLHLLVPLLKTAIHYMRQNETVPSFVTFCFGE
jgi:hypothetical protein